MSGDPVAIDASVGGPSIGTTGAAPTGSPDAAPTSPPGEVPTGPSSRGATSAGATSTGPTSAGPTSAGSTGAGSADRGSRGWPADAPEVRADRHGPLQPGDLVQLTDPKGRHHTFPLRAGAVFHTHKGALEHDQLIGRPEGIVVQSASGVPYLVLRPLLRDFVLSMPRGATVVYPKDAAAIVGLADVFPGATVVEAGAGSGALTCTLLRAVGTAGQVVSFERREDFAKVARGNVERFLGGPQPTWELVVGDLAVDGPARLAAGSVHRFVLDMLAPWECVDVVADALEPGGLVVAYVATTTQLSRVAETLRADGRFTEPAAQELMLRTWHLEGLAVRPDHRMVGHTGFLIVARRLAPGTVLPPKRSRPAPGAYGPDYTGPRAADAPRAEDGTPGPHAGLDVPHTTP